MSLTEENERKNEEQTEFEKSSDPFSLFVLPLEDEIKRENQATLDNAAPIEEIPETNFEFSTFNPKPKPESSFVSHQINQNPPESTAETMRNTGLAWSAAIVFFGSVVFMLILGWFADLLFGSSPWGIVVGIIFGSIIGFMQFFRITSQIINPKKTELQNTPLKLNESEDSPEKIHPENENSKFN